MKNNKGFTLVELLVTVVILGIITGISIPLVRNVQKANENKKYDTYLKSLLTGAKIYNSSYSEDIFGNQKNGCAYITYNQLKSRNLIKEIQIDNITCDTENTFVRTIKTGDKYSYKVFLGCGKTKDNITEILPKSSTPHERDDKYCGGLNETSIEISATPDANQIKNSWSKEIEANVILNSYLGIDKDKLKIQYAWATKNDSENTYNLVTEYKNVTFDVPSNKKQQENLENGEATIAKSDSKIKTPANFSGKIYLLVKVEELKDNYGTNVNLEKNTNYIGKDNTLAFGYYNIDNEPPKVEITNIYPANNDNKNTTIKFKASDTYTKPEALEFCITVNNSKACTETKKLTNYQIESKTTTQIDGQLEYDLSKYTGKSVTIRVFAKDKAGNVGNGSKLHQLPNTYTLIYDSQGGSKCNPEKKEISTIVGSGITWGTLCKPTKTNKQFDGWYTEKNGGGDLVTKDTPINTSKTKPTTVYAKWKESKIYFRFQVQNDEQLTPNTSNGTKTYSWKRETSYNYVYRSLNSKDYELYTVEYDATNKKVTLPAYNSPTGLNITKNGLVAFNSKEWKCTNCKASNKTFKVGSNSSVEATDLCDSSSKDCYVTLKVNWNDYKVNIMLNTNGVNNINGRNGYKVDSKGNVLKNDSKIIHEISYGGTLPNQGLLDYNNSSYLNVTRNNYVVPKGAEWNTKKDGTGISYNQETVYKASDFCDASIGDCSVTLYLNWKKIEEEPSSSTCTELSSMDSKKTGDKVKIGDRSFHVIRNTSTEIILFSDTIIQKDVSIMSGATLKKNNEFMNKYYHQECEDGDTKPHDYVYNSSHPFQKKYINSYINLVKNDLCSSSSSSSSIKISGRLPSFGEIYLLEKKTGTSITENPKGYWTGSRFFDNDITEMWAVYPTFGLAHPYYTTVDEKMGIRPVIVIEKK